MSDKKDVNDPSNVSLAYEAMKPKWDLITTVLGGTDAMREAGELYLPMHTEETPLGYQERLNSSVLFNMLDQTLNTLVGKPFSDGLVLNEDIPEVIVNDIVPDIDLQGNHLEVFCKNWFEDGIAKAFSDVLIDFPRINPTENGIPRTLADDRNQKLRPYWIHIKPESIFFARSEVIKGEEVLLHIRMFEEVVEQVGFTEEVVPQIRVLEPGTVTLYRETTIKGKTVWTIYDQWATGIQYIPMVTFYAKKDGFRLGKPPLLDLAHLNVAHWQSTADQRHILTVTRFPILACSGASQDDSGPVVIGPNKILYNSDPSGRFYYVEHTGAAITAGREDLKSLEDQMSAYGAEFLREKTGNQTATAKAIDTAESSSDLASMAKVFEDAVAQALDITADWMGLGLDGGTVTLKKEYNEAEENPAALQTLTAARAARDISRKAYIEALKSRDILPDDFDQELDAEELLDEPSVELGNSETDLNPGEKTINPNDN